jgi:DNA polymerase I-like protein with 3'-5' exonuclease and polymerase domains
MANKLTMEGAPTTPQVAQGYIQRYNEVYPGVIARRKEWLREHQRNGHVQYLLGNKRFLLDVDWTSRREMHKAETVLSNNLCQGSAQQMLKCAIVRADPMCINPDRAVLSRMTFSREHTLKIRDIGYRLEKLRREFRLAGLEWALQVHDENLYFVDTAAAEDIAPKVADIMTWVPYFEPITSISVPIMVDGGVGDSWKEAKGKTPRFKVEAAGHYWE